MRQSRDICAGLRSYGPGLNTNAVLVLDGLEDLPESYSQATYQVGVAIGSLCHDQNWRVNQ